MYTSPLSLREFYEATLKQAGFTSPSEDIEKVAKAQNIDVKTATIAKSVFEQFQLDGIQHETIEARLQDSYKIANAWLEHEKRVQDDAKKLAEDLHKVASIAVEQFLAHNRVDLKVEEALKIAALQAASFNSPTSALAEPRRDTEKSAFWGAPLSQHVRSADNVNIQDVNAELNKRFNVSDDHIQAVASRMTGNDPAKLRAWYHAKATELSKGGHSTFDDLVSSASKYNENTGVAAAPKPLLSRPGVLLGAGALGAGALYLMHKKKKEHEQAMQNRYDAISGAAGLPSA